MTRPSRITPWLLLPLLLLASFPAAAAVPPTAPQDRRDEEFRYRWQLSNFVGSLAGLFLPNHGEGTLTFQTQSSGLLKSELLITSADAKKGEYWRYGSLIDTQRLHAVSAWSSYLWRGEAKSKTSEVGEGGVMDIVSGIYAIRRDPPTKPRPMEIWSDGRIYPVLVIPGKLERRGPPSRSVVARHFSIRADEIRKGQNRWKGKLDLWLTPDDDAVPVEILISRNLADIRLHLQPPSTARK
jgi:hypothetical protein